MTAAPNFLPRCASGILRRPCCKIKDNPTRGNGTGRGSIWEDADMSLQNRRGFVLGVGAAAIGAGLASRGLAQKPAEPTQANDDAAPLKKEIVPGSPSPNYSRAVKAGGWVYVAGVLGQTPGTRAMVSSDFAAQCRVALENMKASVEAAGSTLDKVVKCNAYLTNQSDFATFNQVYIKFFPENPPARSTVIVKELVMPGAKIEIDCVAIA